MPQTPGNEADADPLHVRVLTACEVDIGPTWRYRGLCSTYWRYYVNSSDGCSLRLTDGSTYRLPAGFVHFVPAGVVFDANNLSQSVTHLYAHFDIVGLPGTLVRQVFDRPASLPLNPALRASSEAMRHAQRHQRERRLLESSFASKAAIYAALAALIAQLDADRAARLAAVLRPDSPVAPALRFVEANLGRPIRVSALGGMCGFAEAHFSRVFRREVGQTPGQYVLERRVAVAAQRLVLSDESIESIADACGFPDRFYFSRVFTRSMGMPPAAYRRAEPDMREWKQKGKG